MAHIINPHKEYQLLQQRLDMNVTGAPASPVFEQILHLLFTPQQAALARRIPTRPVSVSSLARKLNAEMEDIENQIIKMAEKGLVMDFVKKGRRYVSLSPVVIGFFEFTFMRDDDGDLPLPELAKLFDQYMFANEDFAQAVFTGKTQLGRSLVREEALPTDHFVEILDYERATHLVGSATSWGVSTCSCRHKNLHMGKACDQPLRTCMTLNYAAESLIRNGLAERIDRHEAFTILEEAKQKGLAQTADNVQKQATYICNCCGCCCGMMNAIRHFNLHNAIVTSNWLMEVDLDRCNGCGQCVKSCPVNAITVAEEKVDWRDEHGRRRTRKRWAVRDAALCLGCGTCFGACKYDGIKMVPRKQRVHTPETVYERTILMAIERGKLAGLIFDDPENLSHRALGKVIQVLQSLPPTKAALAIQPLRSTFLKMVVGTATKQSGEMKKTMA